MKLRKKITSFFPVFIVNKIRWKGRFTLIYAK